VHSKKIGTVFSMGLIQRFFVIPYLFYGTGRSKFPENRTLRQKGLRIGESRKPQIIRNFGPPVSVEISVNPAMKSRLAPPAHPRLARLVLLYTRDEDFKTVVRQALWDTGTILLTAQTAEEALQIVCRRERELDVAIMAFNEECRGMTLLGAIHGCCNQLSTLVVVDSEQARAFAYANGARFCMDKPVSPTQLANAIADLEPVAPQVAVA